jgi:signal transduction histidine kinase
VDEYQARIKRLLERERSLTDDISHELRTPTSVITTASELLLDDPTVAGVVRRRVERIARAARKTGTVVETLLFLGREESGDATVAVDVQDVVRETVEIFRPLAEAKGIELVAECTGQERIAAPPGTLAIVLQNLVENAVRFTEHGNVRVLYESGKLIVEDTGVGLGGVDANRIFERGYRSDASRGSGLGLDLTRRICERVGWQVSASPRSTGGTRFEVSLAGSIIV